MQNIQRATGGKLRQLLTEIDDDSELFAEEIVRKSSVELTEVENKLRELAGKKEKFEDALDAEMNKPPEQFRRKKDSPPLPPDCLACGPGDLEYQEWLKASTARDDARRQKTEETRKQFHEEFTELTRKKGELMADLSFANRQLQKVPDIYLPFNDFDPERQNRLLLTSISQVPKLQKNQTWLFFLQNLAILGITKPDSHQWEELRLVTIPQGKRLRSFFLENGQPLEIVYDSERELFGFNESQFYLP